MGRKHYKYVIWDSLLAKQRLKRGLSVLETVRETAGEGVAPTPAVLYTARDVAKAQMKDTAPRGDPRGGNRGGGELSESGSPLVSTGETNSNQTTLSRSAQEILDEELALLDAQELALGIGANNVTYQAQQHAAEAMKTVLGVMRSSRKDALRLKAAQEVLLRAHGRPGTQKATDPRKMTDDELTKRARLILEQRAANERKKLGPGDE